jgi:hypothetical protein
LVQGKTIISRELTTFQPEFGGCAAALHVHVWRLLQIVADEVEPEPVRSENGRHPPAIPAIA